MYNGRTAQKYPPTSHMGGMEDNRMKRGLLFGGIIVAAMLAFELFNYTTTDFALTNLLGDLRFVGLRWATILSIAFCGMDFAGIARLFTPEKGRGERTETWYLLAAWFLAATMNAMLTWWGVSLALLTHEGLGNEILGRQTLLSAVPVFVSILVWLIRILLIGLLSMAGERLFSFMEQNLREDDELRPASQPHPAGQRQTNSAPARLPTAEWAGGSNHRPAPVTSPVMKANAGSARVIGSADDAPRPTTVAERHGYGRIAQNQNTTTTSRDRVPSTPVRPAPKPSAAPSLSSNGVRPVPARVPAPSGNGNGLHRTTDYDFDD